MATGESNLGLWHYKKAARAHDENDLERQLMNLVLALIRFIVSSRIYRAIGRIDDANRASGHAVDVDKQLQQLAITKAATATRV